MSDICDFWDYVDTCRVGSGGQSHQPFISRTRRYYGEQYGPLHRPAIETWPDLRRYICETLNAPHLEGAAFRTWTNYMIYHAGSLAALTYRDLWRLRRQLREEQEARLQAEEKLAQRDVHARAVADAYIKLGKALGQVPDEPKISPEWCPVGREERRGETPSGAAPPT